MKVYYVLFGRFLVVATEKELNETIGQILGSGFEPKDITITAVENA